MSVDTQNRRIWILVALLVAFFALLGLCCVGWLVVRRVLPESSEAGAVQPPQAPAFTIAYSPEKEALFTRLVSSFNADVAASSDDVLSITAVRYEPDLMIEAALEGKFQAMSPDSSLWLDVLDREWAARTERLEGQPREAPLVGQWERYAVSPVVIAMWEDVARSMGYPDKALGWADLLDRAQSDPEFKWSHPSTSSSAGLLATLAMFYAGAGKTRDLAEADVLRQETLDHVAAVQQTVRYYGEGEWAVVQRLLREGRSYLDAFVCQEQLVVYLNSQTTRMGTSGQMGTSERVVAIYPVEGALWEDHPLALLETDGLTDPQRATFKRFVEYVKAPATQTTILAAGYRPTDLSIPLDSPDSPLTAENGVDPAQPQTTLQMPSPSVIQVVRDVWWYTKRHTNVYLVADVSGSMEGDKLDNAQQALRVFMEQIQGDMERVGLVRFSTNASEVVPLNELGRNRADVNRAIDQLRAGGDTALLDGVNLAYGRLQALGDTERINAIVVMTDGQENNSRIGLSTLVARIADENERGVPIVIFTIGYGDDADENVLRTLAEASGGQYYTGDLETIRRLYKILSAYF